MSIQNFANYTSLLNYISGNIERNEIPGLNFNTQVKIIADIIIFHPDFEFKQNFDMNVIDMDEILLNLWETEEENEKAA